MSADPRRVASPSGTGGPAGRSTACGHTPAQIIGADPEGASPCAACEDGAAPTPPYTDGRFVVAWVGAEGARDPIMLTSQVKMMRDGFGRLGHEPGLIVVVVASDEVEAAAALISEALGG